MAGLITVRDVQLRAGSEFPPNWVSGHICEKEAFPSHDILQAYCVAHPGTLRVTQVRVGIDN